MRTELSYRDRNLLERAWDLRSAISLEQKRQLAYVDVYLPPFETSQLDSFGLLKENSDISGLITRRNAIGYKRALTHGKIEQRQGINLSHAENS